MPTKRSVSNIKSKLLNPALTSHFEVEIAIPGFKDTQFRNYLKDNGVNYDQEKLNLMCSEASLPGSSFATHEITNDFSGVTERHAYRRVYDDRIDLTFYVDAENYLPIRFFETWMKWIANESIKEKEGGPKGTKQPEYFYRMRYPKEYRTEGLKITKFERGYTNSILRYEFVGAYPISITSMPVSYDASSLLKCSVSLTYTRFILLPAVNDTEGKDGREPTPANQPAALQSGDPSVPSEADKRILELMSGPNAPTTAELIAAGFEVASAPQTQAINAGLSGADLGRQLTRRRQGLE